MKRNLFLLVAMLMVGTSLWAAEPVSTKAKCGESFTITATALPGYEFSHWADDASLTSSTRVVTVSDASKVLEFEAVFVPKKYTIKVESADPDMGSVRGGGEAAYASEVAIEAVPASQCYRFDHWNDGNQDNPRVVVVTDDDDKNTYTAYFVEAELTLTAKESTMGTITITKIEE